LYHHVSILFNLINFLDPAKMPLFTRKLRRYKRTHNLQREFHLALSHPRHLVPSHTISSGPPPRPDLSSLIASLMAALHVLEMYRRNVPDHAVRRLLDRPRNSVGRQPL